LKVGDYLLSTYFDGDASLYTDARRSKEMGFEGLLSEQRDALTEMGLKPTMLRNCVRAFVVWRGLHPQLRDGFDFSALVALAPLSDLRNREKLAGEALAQKWSAREIGQAVLAENKAQHNHKKKLGRPSLPAALKHALKLVRAGKTLPTHANQLHHLNATQHKELRQGAGHLREKLDKLIAALDAAPAAPPAPA